jgi:CBS domain-containing protein
MGLEKKKLDAIQKAVKAKQRPSATVRQLLSWFDCKRRGSWVVGTIREELTKRGLATEPDFESAWFDGQVTFVPIVVPPARERSDVEENEESPGLPAAAIPPVGALIRANAVLVSVAREAPVEEATTLMLLHDFSQLPVMPAPKSRTKHGMVSWRSIGQARVLRESCTKVADCMEPAESLLVDESIYKAIDIIRSRDAVLVRNTQREIIGILTAADITDQFRFLSEPFLLLAEIEGRVRRLIERGIPAKDLATWKDPADESRVVTEVSKLTFGEAVRGLERPDNWSRMKLNLDRRPFLARLREVGRIRNEVMHFHPDKLPSEDLEILRQTSEFMQRVDQVVAR